MSSLIYLRIKEFFFIRELICLPNGEIASDNHMKVDAINKLFKLSQ